MSAAGSRHPALTISSYIHQAENMLMLTRPLHTLAMSMMHRFTCQQSTSGRRSIGAGQTARTQDCTGWPVAAQTAQAAVVPTFAGVKGVVNKQLCELHLALSR